MFSSYTIVVSISHVWFYSFDRYILAELSNIAMEMVSCRFEDFILNHPSLLDFSTELIHDLQREGILARVSQPVLKNWINRLSDKFRENGYLTEIKALENMGLLENNELEMNLDGDDTQDVQHEGQKTTSNKSHISDAGCEPEESENVVVKNIGVSQANEGHSEREISCGDREGLVVQDRKVCISWQNGKHVKRESLSLYCFFFRRAID